MEKKYPVGGFAPGGYLGRCEVCGTRFEGDKRAWQCEPCGETAQAAWDAERARKLAAMTAEYGPPNA